MKKYLIGGVLLSSLIASAGMPELGPRNLTVNNQSDYPVQVKFGDYTLLGTFIFPPNVNYTFSPNEEREVTRHVGSTCIFQISAERNVDNPSSNEKDTKIANFCDFSRKITIKKEDDQLKINF